MANISLFTHHYGEKLENWCKKLNIKTDSDSETFIVAIARKCPRLFDLIEREFNKLGKEINFDFENIITEHALPFHFYSDAWKPYSKKYILCDDSILFGSTFSKINDFIKTLHEKRIEKSQIQNQGKIDIIYRPFAFNENDNNNDELIVKIKNERNYCLSLSENDELISTFINREMSAFLTEGPYDIEFPIITWNLPEEDTANGVDVVSKIDKALKKFVENIGLPENAIYSNVYDTVLISGANPVKNKSVAWTILVQPMNERNNRLTEPEFSKLRFFLNADKTMLKVVSFSPFPITKDVIRNFSLYLPDDEFKKLYTLPYDYVKDILKLNETDLDESGKYLLYQTDRSIVIWINYLLSFNQLVQYQQNLDELRVSLGCDDQGIDIKEIRYLLGNSLTDELYPMLCNWINKKWTIKNFSVDYDSVYSNNFRETIVPEKYYSDFTEEIRRKYDTCVSFNEMVSRHFDTQHRILDEESRRRNYKNKFKRLRFGITFRGLYYDLNIYKELISRNANNIIKQDNDTWYLRSNLIRTLHQTMDEHIDKGSVVPKYIKLENGHKPVWTRMFKSGERVLPLIEIEHISEYLISLLQEKSQIKGVNPIILESYLLHSMGNNLSMGEMPDFTDYSIKKKIREVNKLPMICLAMKISNGQEIFLSDWLKNLGYMVEEEFMPEYKLNVQKDPERISLPYGNELLRKKFGSIANCFASILTNHQQSRDFYSFILKFSLLGITENEGREFVKTLQMKFFNEWKGDFTTTLDEIKQNKEVDKERMTQINLNIYLYQNYYRYVDIQKYLEKEILQEDCYFIEQLQEYETLFQKDIDDILYIASLLNALINIAMYNTKNIIIVDEDKLMEIVENQENEYQGLRELLEIFQTFIHNKQIREKEIIISKCERLFNMIIEKYP